jgi:hypothetical protein
MRKVVSDRRRPACRFAVDEPGAGCRVPGTDLKARLDRAALNREGRGRCPSGPDQARFGRVELKLDPTVLLPLETAFRQR